jgi:hypothetical protein
MDAALIALMDRGAHVTFLGEPFRSRKEIPNEDIVDLNFRQVEITDADVEVLLPLTNLEGISFWQTGITDRAIELIAPLPRLARLNLCGTRVTDASVSALIGMRLDYIDVADTPLTTESKRCGRDCLGQRSCLDRRRLHGGPRPRATRRRGWSGRGRRAGDGAERHGPDRRR